MKVVKQLLTSSRDRRKSEKSAIPIVHQVADNSFESLKMPRKNQMPKITPNLKVSFWVK